MERARRWNEIALIGAPVGAGAGTAGCVMGRPRCARSICARRSPLSGTRSSTAAT